MKVAESGRAASSLKYDPTYCSPRLLLFLYIGLYKSAVKAL